MPLHAPLAAVLAKAGWSTDAPGLWTVLALTVRGKTVLRLGLSPHTRVQVRASSGGISVMLSPGLRVQTPGLELRVGVLSYRFGCAAVVVEESPEAEGPRRVPKVLRAGLLKSVSWVASQWLRAQLPYGMRQKGYDWFADPARLAHVAYIVERFGAMGAKGKKADGKQAEGKKEEASLLQKLMPQAHQPLGLVGGEAVLWKGEAGALGTIAVCVRQGASLDVRRGLHFIEIHADGGLFVAIPDLAWVQELRLDRVRIALDDLGLRVEASPPLGPLPMALVQKLFADKVAPMVRMAIEKRWGLGGVLGGEASVLDSTATASDGTESIVIAHHSLGSAGIFAAYLAVNDTLTLRYTGKTFEVLAPLGLHIGISDLDFLPNLHLRSLVYDVEDATLSLGSTPGAAAFENTIVTQLVRHRALPHVPVGLLGWRAPQAQQPLSALRAAHPLVLVDVDIPVLGRLEVRIHPADTLRISLSDVRWSIQSERKVLLIAPDIDLTLEVGSLVYDFSTNRLALDASLAPDDYGTAFLVGLLESFAWPPLRKIVELPKPGKHWTLYKIPNVMGGIEITLDAGDTLHITRGPSHLGVAVDQGLWVRPADTTLLGGAVRIRRLSLDLPSGQLGLQTQPALGEFSVMTAQRLLGKLGAAVLNPILARLGVVALAPEAAAQPAASKSAVTLFSQTLPVIGPLHVLLDTTATVSLGLDARQLRLTLNDGLRLRLPGLALEHSVRSVALNLAGNWTLHLDTNPPLGALEKRIIEGQIRTHLQPLAAKMLPPHPEHRAPHAEDNVLLVLGQGQSWGPLVICASANAPLTATLTPRLFTLFVEGGLCIRSPAIDPFMPEFRLSKLEYALGIGQISLDVCEIAQRFYHEEHDVGSTTEQLIEYALKALVAPKLPPICHQLGVVGFDDDEGDLEHVEGIRLLHVPLGAALGEAVVALDPDDQIEISFEGQEIILQCQEGILVNLDALRFSARIDEVRYHLTSGEVFVRKFGQFENALIEALLARAFGAGRLVKGVSYSPLGAFLEECPLDPKLGREIFQLPPSKTLGMEMLSCYLDPTAQLKLTLSAHALRFTATPGLLLDGPGFVNLRADGFVYEFAEARFKLFLRKGNPLTGLLSGGVRMAVESILNNKFRQYLPEAMLQPGYNLADDAQSAEHIAQLIHRFSANKNKT